jgi:hypothetical protein
LLVRIEAAAYFLSGFKAGKASSRNGNRGAGGRVPPGTSAADLYGEYAEAAQFNSIAARHCHDYLIKDGVDDIIYIALGKVRTLSSDAPGKFGSKHLICTPN